MVVVGAKPVKEEKDKRIETTIRFRLAGVLW